MKDFIELVASEGHVYTQSLLENGCTRIFSEYLCLGKNDSPENWEEWTIEQMEEYERNNVMEEMVIIEEPIILEDINE